MKIQKCLLGKGCSLCVPFCVTFLGPAPGMILAVSPMSALCHDVVLRLNVQESFFSPLVSQCWQSFAPQQCVLWGHTCVRCYCEVDCFKLLELAQLYKQWLLGINWFSVCSLTSREAPESVPGSRVVEDRVSQKVNEQNEVILWKIRLFCLLSCIWAGLGTVSFREGRCVSEVTPISAH